MPKIKVNDISMYYEIHGEGEPIVFIAGFSVDHTTWNGIIPLLKNNYKVIIFDNRGAGQTDAPTGPYSIEQMTNDLVELCSQLNIKKAHFVGNSMGGFILQTLAFRHPNLVKSAIISNSTANIHTCFHYYVAAQLELIKANAPLESIIKASCPWAFSYQFLTQPGVYESLVQLSLQNPYPFSITGYEGQYAALDTFNSTEWAKQINVPTLVMSGDQDLIFSKKSVKHLADQIPNAEYFCFSECGHLPFLEYPKEFIQTIIKFIETVA